MTDFYVALSWDDGSVHDMRLAEILQKRNLPATFFIPQRFDSTGGKYRTYDRRLADLEIINISDHFEVGAHGLSHTPLTNMPIDQLTEEVVGSKAFLESIIHREVAIFSYPLGHANDLTRDIVKQAGFKGARLTGKLNFTVPMDPFSLTTTVQVSPFPFRKHDDRHFYWRRLFDPLNAYAKLGKYPTFWPHITSWRNLAYFAFNYALRNGNYFHLYGHSWELAKYKMWSDLEWLLEKIQTSDRFGRQLKFITNSELVVIGKQ